MLLKATGKTATNKVRKVAAPSSRRGQQRMGNILKAAIELFLKNGYGATSVNMIIARSGGSKATFYSYFPSKDVLLRAVVDEIVSNREEPDLGSSEDIRTALVTFAKQRLRIVFSRQHQALLGLIIAERERFPDIARMYYELGPKRSHGQVVEYMRGLEKRGRLDIENAEESAEFFIGMLLHQWYISQLYQRSPMPTLEAMEQRAEHVVGRFLEAFRKPAAGG